MVFEGLVADVLSKVLGDYVKNLNKDQLKIGIFGGMAIPCPILSFSPLGMSCQKEVTRMINGEVNAFLYLRSTAAENAVWNQCSIHSLLAWDV